MSPKPLDLKMVGDRLAYQARLMTDLRRLPVDSLADFQSDWRNVPTAESLLRRAIESLLDVARHLLSSAFGMGSLEYRQVAQLAAEEDVLRDPELAARFVQIAGFRNRLTHYYEAVTPEELYNILCHHVSDLDAVAAELRRAAEELGYLTEEAASADGSERPQTGDEQAGEEPEEDV